jgi:hypothetical protein
MTALRLSAALVLAMAACLSSPGDSGGQGCVHVPDPGPPQPGGGGQSPPKVRRGPQKMSDVHVEPGGDRVWIVHHAVADLDAVPNVTTAHLGVWVPDTGEFAEVLDTTDTLGKRILFPGTGRVLYVTQRGTDRDVFVTVDTVARQPLAQRTYPGDRTNFRVSPSGRAVLSTDKTDAKLHLLDTASLVDQAMPDGIGDPDDIAWAPGDDVLYALQLAPGTIQLVRYDLRTADLSAPLAPPTVVAADPGFYGAIAVSPDARYLGIASGSSHVKLIDTTTGAARAVAGESISGFARDGRAIIWQTNTDNMRDFRLVDPATGAAAPTVATGWLFPVARPLRSHDILLVDALDQALHPDVPPFLYHTGDGTRTASPSASTSAAFASSSFERPGHDELWMWFEYDAALRRLDLTTGETSDVVDGDDSVDYRAAADDIVIGGFRPSLRRLAMATGHDLGAPLVLADPNDVPAPYQLDDQ